MVRATSKTEWIGAALLLHALDPVLKRVGLNPHLHMSAFLLLLWPRCQWILCWLLSKQENYSTSPPISGLVFLVFPRTIHFPRNSGKEFLPILLQTISQLSLFAALSDRTSEHCPLLTVLQPLWPPCHAQMHQAHAPVMHLLPPPPGTLLPVTFVPPPSVGTRSHVPVTWSLGWLT